MTATTHADRAVPARRLLMLIGRCPPGHRRFRDLAAIGAVAALGLAAVSCSGRPNSVGSIHHTPTTKTGTPAGTTPGLTPIAGLEPTPIPAASSTTAPTTATAPAPRAAPTAAPFPALVVQAMDQFNPLPAGAEAPIRLPSVPGYLTAQTGGLGGQDNVTLIITARPLPVNSPALSSAGAGKELASFATTPSASASDASAALAQAKSQSIDSCAGPSHPVGLAGGTTAMSCPTVDGAALTWDRGPWVVQVVTLSGTVPSTAEAGQVEVDLQSTGLPASGGGGIVSVVVPGSPSAGSADTAALEWVRGADIYQVRSADDPPAAIAVAAAMRPYPG